MVKKKCNILLQPYLIFFFIFIFFLLTLLVDYLINGNTEYFDVMIVFSLWFLV